MILCLYFFGYFQSFLLPRCHLFFLSSHLFFVIFTLLMSSSQNNDVSSSAALTAVSGCELLAGH